MSDLFTAMGELSSIDIGLIVTAFMLFMVIIGVRVAFAAASAGFSACYGFSQLSWALKKASVLP
ncbi:hypothetical protein [Aliamphritea spongicola]|nr:hypothetical protein [Aliamphritea spongicola]